ncbi:gamma-glutamylcyclotransferase [Limnohabitans sp. G3-2]|uniref:gamma-glutamylcyclotransferase n=1 Tax=Limnohabitans sp. G3-2 TaxID=1100711 RepID=UPI000C1F3BA6|nr:gamma-glutamylcyclotransferase [Limnohabitans sp. G3-2]PIT78053.1 gamma-glutamylcyclotransferase [Limnohabitans sp. G3-2]
MTDTLAATAQGEPADSRSTAYQGPLLDQFRAQTAGQDLWVFGYASLLWRPEFEAEEQYTTRVWGWHRALKMWSRLNRGSPECPGLVFALLPGGSCQGVVYRVHKTQADEVLTRLWAREMPMDVYTPNWLPCATPHGPVKALAFTLHRSSPSFTGDLPAETYQQIFRQASGRFGTTRDYAQLTYQSLQEHGIEDRALAALLRHAN